MASRILFVDDDPAALDSLRRSLEPIQDEWEMVFVPSGEEALSALRSVEFSVLVTDLDMPGMDGPTLLDQVVESHPGVVRIALLEAKPGESTVRSVDTTHRYISKPCDVETLMKTVTRARALQILLADEALKRLVAHMKSLPSVPALYTRLLKECRSERASLKTVSEIIAEDVGMTAKVLHLVNSAFFGLKARVSGPLQAVQLLGLETVKSLVLCASVFSQFDGKKLGRFSMNTFWRHSLIAGSFAGIIAREERRDQFFANEVSVAGLLHDAGQLILASNLPQKYSEVMDVVQRGEAGLCDAEKACFGATHATVGAYLLGLWGLPDSLVEAVAYHHSPADGPLQTFTPLTAVHVADAFAEELQNTCGGSPGLDLAYLESLSATSRVERWRQGCSGYAGETQPASANAAR